MQEATESQASQEAQVLSIRIARPWPAVCAYLGDPANMNDWASGLGHSLRQEQGVWQAAGPEGPVSIRFSPANTEGIADHWVTVAPGVEVHVPLRALPCAEGAEVQLTLLRQPGMSEAAYAADADWIRRDLATLKTRLEG